MDRYDRIGRVLVVAVATLSLLATTPAFAGRERARPASSWQRRLVGKVGAAAMAASLLAGSGGTLKAQEPEGLRREALPDYVAAIVSKRHLDGRVEREWGWIGKYSLTLYKGPYPRLHEVGDGENLTMTEYLNRRIDALPAAPR